MAQTHNGDRASGLGAVSFFLQARSAVYEATVTLLDGPRRPDAARFTALFEAYLSGTRHADPSEALSRFFMLVTEAVAQRGMELDPLMLYVLRANIATRLDIEDR